MANIKIIAIDKRDITIEVTWANGWERTFVAHNCPVESLDACKEYLNTYISSLYAGVEREEAEKAYANPVIPADVLAAIGHTFDDTGAIIS